MYYIGVDLGGTNIAVGIVNESFSIVEKGSVPTKADRDPELIIKDMADLCGRLIHKNNIPLEQVAYVGIASPGIADIDRGLIVYTNNIPFHNFPIAEIFKKYLPVSNVYVANDANAAAMGEAIAGAAKGAKNSVMITLGTGVGGGVIIDGKIFTGFNMAGAELGHTVIAHNGRSCSCGRRGCFEAYSSATALVKMTEEKVNQCNILSIPTLMNDEIAANNGRINARIAFNAMKKGDPVAKELIDTYIEYLACGITNMINIFQPEILSIGGGISNEKEWLLEPLNKIVDRHQYSRDCDNKCKVVIAQLGNDAGIIGAACLGQQFRA